VIPFHTSIQLNGKTSVTHKCDMADPALISVALGIVAKKALETLAGKVSEEVWKKLQGAQRRKPLRKP
jgi:hypothetical protein